MFGKKNTARESKETEAKRNEPFTYIHRGTLFEGNLSAKGRVRVHGTVRGKVVVGGVLEVAEGGVVEGDVIQAEEVKILGTVKANIEAKGKVEIWKKGTLEGDVRASALDIEEGASFTGRSDMRPQAKAASLPSVSADKVAPKPPSLAPGRVAEGA